MKYNNCANRPLSSLLSSYQVQLPLYIRVSLGANSWLKILNGTNTITNLMFVTHSKAFNLLPNHCEYR